MSGQNHKVKTVKKASSGSPAKFSPAFFTYRADTDIKSPELRCNPKPGDVGKPNPQVLKNRN